MYSLQLKYGCTDSADGSDVIELNFAYILLKNTLLGNVTNEVGKLGWKMTEQDIVTFM